MRPPTVPLNVHVLCDSCCSFTSESMDPESTMVYAYYKEGSSSPTFLYPK